jgi:ABC-type sugar transport system permease subunit
MPPMAALQELTRPRAIAVSFWCWLVAGVVVGVTAVLEYTRLDPMHTEFASLARDRDTGATQATIDRVASASVLVVIGTGVALAVLCVALALVLRAGRGWGRVFLAVVALIAVAYAAVVSSAVSEPMLDDLRIPVVAGLLGFTVLVLVAAVGMFLPGTTAWFRRPKGH